MTAFLPARERGATLLVALVMLLIMTVLAVSSMRGVVLESRITGNRAENLRLQEAASAAPVSPPSRTQGESLALIDRNPPV